jgi:hypothetical protein
VEPIARWLVTICRAVLVCVSVTSFPGPVIAPGAKSAHTAQRNPPVEPSGITHFAPSGHEWEDGQGSRGVSGRRPRVKAAGSQPEATIICAGGLRPGTRRPTDLLVRS